jgi:hypothetical protein
LLDHRTIGALADHHPRLETSVVEMAVVDLAVTEYGGPPSAVSASTQPAAAPAAGGTDVARVDCGLIHP